MSGPCADCGGPDYQTLIAELAEANATIDGMDSWAGMMEQARKHYPQDVAYFAQSNNPGCRIVRGLHAIDAERQHAEQAEAERDALREALRICYEEGWPSTENEHPWLRNDPEHLEPPEYERAMTPDEFVESVASGQPREGGEG